MRLPPCSFLVEEADSATNGWEMALHASGGTTCVREKKRPSCQDAGADAHVQKRFLAPDVGQAPQPLQGWSLKNWVRERGRG